MLVSTGFEHEVLENNFLEEEGSAAKNKGT
jgi:hypothetical protein